MSQDVWKKLKKDVRSLVLSSKTGLDADQLRKDYISMLGHPMPLKELGFRNIMDLIVEMPDVVSVNYRSDGSAYFRVVGDDSTRHMEELVAKQRMPKTGRISRGYNRQYYPCKSYAVLPRRSFTPPAPPAHLKAQLRLILSKGELRLSELESCYLRYFGQPLRVHNFGYYSIGEMLEGVKDMVLIQQGKFGSVLVLKDHMLPRSFQTTPSAPRRTGPIKPNPSPPIYPASTYPLEDVLVPTQYPGEVKLYRGSLDPQARTMPSQSYEESRFVGAPSTAAKTSDTKPESNQEDQSDQSCVSQLERELRQQILEYGLSGVVGQELKEKLRKVVNQATGDLSVHDLPAAYRQRFGEDLPLLQTGFVSVTELVGALSDIFHLEPAEDDRGQHWLIKEKPKTDAGAVSNEVPEYLDKGSVDWKTNEDLVDKFVENDENKEQETRSFSRVVTTCYPPLSKGYPDMSALFSSKLPPDAVLSERLNSPTRYAARQVAAVVVETVVSPAHFYIRFTRNEESNAMEKLMLEMRLCYASPEVSHRYRLPEQYIRRGQVCCVSPAGMWFYRVVIHSIISPTQVQVYYVDFGDLIVVQTSRLKFLKINHSVLPVQAVPASLRGIRPISGHWSADAIASFTSLTTHQTLVGALDYYTGEVLQLYLCDTSTDEDAYVHEVMANQGFGILCSYGVTTGPFIPLTPVSLYISRELSDLPKVNDDLLSYPDGSEAPAFSPLASAKIDYEEMPSLELIEDYEIPTTQDIGSDSGPVEQEDEIISGSDKEIVENESAPNSPACPAPPAIDPPAEIPTSTPEAETETQPETKEEAPSISTPISDSEVAGPSEEAKEETEVEAAASPSLPAEEPPAAVMTAVLYKPMQSQIASYYTAGTFAPISSSMTFPMFGGRQALRSTSSTTTQLINQIQRLFTRVKPEQNM